MKKIYLVRHGQTKFNELGIVQGRGIDASLNEKGRSQAKMFYEAYKDVPFEKVYISTLKRTYESVQAFIDDDHIAHIKHEGFDEISWGDHEGVEASLERNKYFQELVGKWNSGKTDIRIEGGESPEDVANRQKPVIAEIINSDEKIILICMHGRAIRVLLCQLLNKPLTKMDSFGHHNLGLYILNYENGQFTIDLDNSIDHLA